MLKWIKYLNSKKMFNWFQHLNSKTNKDQNMNQDFNMFRQLF